MALPQGLFQRGSWQSCVTLKLFLMGRHFCFELKFAGFIAICKQIGRCQDFIGLQFVIDSSTGIKHLQTIGLGAVVCYLLNQERNFGNLLRGQVPDFVRPIAFPEKQLEGCCKTIVIAPGYDIYGFLDFSWINGLLQNQFIHVQGPSDFHDYPVGQALTDDLLQ